MQRTNFDLNSIADYYFSFLIIDLIDLKNESRDQDYEEGGDQFIKEIHQDLKFKKWVEDKIHHHNNEQEELE